jgi:hypothetical protein
VSAMTTADVPSKPFSHGSSRVNTNVASSHSLQRKSTCAIGEVGLEYGASSALNTRPHLSSATSLFSRRPVATSVFVIVDPEYDFVDAIVNDVCEYEEGVRTASETGLRRGLTQVYYAPLPPSTIAARENHLAILFSCSATSAHTKA